MCQARELNVIVHVCQGIRHPPVEVSFILHTNGAGASADVCEYGAFPSSSGLFFLPAPFQGEAILEV
jgi:hypothetical protein